MKSTLRTYVAIACLAGALAACGKKVEGSGSAGGPGAAQLSECCQESMALVAQMPDCCRKGISTAGALSGCCATGMLESTADADRPDCCTEGKALLDQFPACCKETVLTGEPDACCEAMPAALLDKAAG